MPSAALCDIYDRCCFPCHISEFHGLSVFVYSGYQSGRRRKLPQVDNGMCGHVRLVLTGGSIICVAMTGWYVRHSSALVKSRIYCIVYLRGIRTKLSCPKGRDSTHALEYCPFYCMLNTRARLFQIRLDTFLFGTMFHLTQWLRATLYFADWNDKKKGYSSPDKMNF